MAERILTLDGPPVVLCTDVVADRYGDRFRAAHPEVRLVPLVGTAHVSDADLERLNVTLFSADAHPERTPHIMKASLTAPGLRWFHTMSAGVDHPVFRQMVDRGITLTNSSGSTASPIAQTVMMYLLALTRDLPGWFRAQQDHRWDQRRISELEGLTIGVVGTGPIGIEVIRLSSAFGMRPIGMRRAVRGDEPCETWTLDRIRDLAEAVDVLVLALPLTDETRGIVDADVLGAMRPGALFVNVGRGELVDEDALVDVLRSGHLGGAGLDVFAVEPLPAEHPLWDLPNVIVTPHSSGTTDRSDQRSIEMFVANLARLAVGEPLHQVVD